jgi:hypothetical protein
MKPRADEWDWSGAIDALEERRAADRKAIALQVVDTTERDTFYERNPWHRFRAGLNDRLERGRVRRGLRLSMWFSGLGLAATAALVVILIMPNQTTNNVSESGVPVQDQSTIRTKGAAQATKVPVERPQLTLYANRVAVQNGSVISPDAHLTFHVNTGRYDHVFVFGVEENGTLTTYYPLREDGSSLMTGRVKGMQLPDGVELDGISGKEKMVAIFSTRPLNWHAVRAVAERSWKAADGRLESMGELGMEDTTEVSLWFDKQIQ